MSLQPEDLAPTTSNNLVLTVQNSANQWDVVPLAALPAHATTHQNGGSDEISVAGLSGLLADAQTPIAHATSHQHGGSDEVATVTPGGFAIPKAGLTGKLGAGWISEVLALADLSDVTGTTGSGTTAVLALGPEINSPHINTIYELGGVTEVLSLTGHGGAHVSWFDMEAVAAGDLKLSAVSSDPNVGINVETVGTGTLQQNGVPVATTTGTQTLSSKTLTTPAIADFTSAQHNHSSAAQGGALSGYATTSGTLAQFAATTSAQLAGVISDETGSGALVFGTSPTIVTPTVASFTNATHNHTNAAGGGTLDHGAALTGLSDDDHTQYALLAGRSLGQTLYGGNDAGEALTLRSTTHGTKGTVTFPDPLQLSDQAASSATAGRLQRNGTTLSWGDGTARTVVTDTQTQTLTNKTLTTPTIADFTNAQHDHGDADDGGQLAVGTALTNGTPGYTLGAGATVPEWAAHGIRYRREMQWMTDVGATTGTRVGLTTAPTISGTTISNQDGVLGPIVRSVTGAVSGNSGGVLSGFDVTRSGWSSEGNFVCAVGNTITSYRFWCGFTSADLTAVATPTTQHVAAFSYDTARDGTVFFRTVTNDGVGAATVTATSVAFTAGQKYHFRIVFTTSTSIAFYIDNVLTNTHTTTCPATTTNLGFQMSCTTLTSSTRRIDMSRVGIMSI